MRHKTLKNTWGLIFGGHWSPNGFLNFTEQTWYVSIKQYIVCLNTLAHLSIHKTTQVSVYFNFYVQLPYLTTGRKVIYLNIHFTDNNWVKTYLLNFAHRELWFDKNVDYVVYFLWIHQYSWGKPFLRIFLGISEPKLYMFNLLLSF